MGVQTIAHIWLRVNGCRGICVIVTESQLSGKHMRIGGYLFGP